MVPHLGLSRVAVLTTPTKNKRGRLGRSVGRSVRGQFSNGGHAHPLDVTEAALAWCEERQVDGLVAIGGGSTIGLGKALALRTDLPQLCIPTTYAGSEMTDILGQTVDGKKTTQRGPQIQPEVVIYDPELTDTLPPCIGHHQRL